MGGFQEGGFQIVERAAFSLRGNLLLQGNSDLKSTLHLLLRRRVRGHICYLKNPLPKTPHSIFPNKCLISPASTFWGIFRAFGRCFFWATLSNAGPLQHLRWPRRVITPHPTSSKPKELAMRNFAACQEAQPSLPRTQPAP